MVNDGLLPKRTYTYQLQRLNADSTAIETSASVQFTTMDTTTHNFTWRMDTLGITSSVLYDVAIVNDTLAYAAGAIYKLDNLGNWDPNAYNLAKWNGHTWELMRIQFYTFCGQPGTGSYPAKSIFAFSPTDIWIGMEGSQVVRWNGQNQSTPMCTPVSINKLWGENANSVWAVGNNGGIAHYNGITWQRLESGTTISLTDVRGSSDGNVVWACGYRSDLSESILLQHTGSLWQTVAHTVNGVGYWRDSLSGLMGSVWSSRRREITFVAAGGVVYKVPVGSHGEAKLVWLPSSVVGFFTRIRGSDMNNMFVAGQSGTLAHFNGLTWHRYDQFFSLTTGAHLYSVTCAGRYIAAIGESGVVIMGEQYRQF